MIDIPKPILDALSLRTQRGEEYNASGVQREDYFPLGHASYFQMVWVKALRLRSLQGALMKGKGHEGIRDTLLDLINYASFYLEALDRMEETDD